MATIEIELPDQFAEDAERLRGAISELLATPHRDDTDSARHGEDGTPVDGEGSPQTPVEDASTDLILLLEQVARSPGGPSAVTSLLQNLAARGHVLRHITDAVANQPLPLGPATAGQVALVDSAWRAIESRYGAVDAGQYAEFVGGSPTSRSVAVRAKAKGLVGYRRGRRILYPRFQFDQHGLRAGWNDVVAPLRAAGWDDDDIVLWLASPHGALGRRSPVEAIDAGDQTLVLEVVRDESAGVW